MPRGSGTVARAMAENDDQDEKDEKEEAAAEAEGDEGEPKPKPKKQKRAGGKTVRAQPMKLQQQGSSLGKSMLLFVVIVGGIAAGFAILGREQGQHPSTPKWAVGQTVDVEITLVKNDRQDLSCASGDEIGGKHCAFEAQNKPWSKGDNGDDKKLLKPYTTTDRVQFTAAGLWSDPALAADKLPPSRFSVKCKYKVEGMLKNVAVRWEPTGQWYPGNEWYAGSVSDCKVGH